MKLKIAALVLCAFPTAANAFFLDGNMLYQSCQGADNGVDVYNYAMGVSDTSKALGFGDAICVPPNATSGQLADVICRTLSGLPEIRHREAASIALVTLADSFPCQSE